MANGLATVVAFRDVLDAQAAVSKLESEGIECSLASEYVVGVLWRLSTAVGGVEVQVAPDDLERARAILAADESESLEETPGEEREWEPAEACPRGGSEEVRTIQRFRNAAAVAALTGIPIPFWHSGVKCRACENEWKPTAT